MSEIPAPYNGIYRLPVNQNLTLDGEGSNSPYSVQPKTEPKPATVIPFPRDKCRKRDVSGNS